MLNKLLYELDKLPSVKDKLDDLKRRVDKEPTNVEQLVDLIKLATHYGTFDEFPLIDHNDVLQEFSTCRQVLVQKDDYFYI
jgi:hypothetical protein